ncbi:hypothetical protein ACIB24_22850 [Spongisporangium articulatum]|uniref:Uncharacterized protein n=1 Tax=Spongisporangium articulatum TaxID=3362603 RepID=A0ABW8AU50_9ACTN
MFVGAANREAVRVRIREVGLLDRPAAAGPLTKGTALTVDTPEILSLIRQLLDVSNPRRVNHIDSVTGRVADFSDEQATAIAQILLWLALGESEEEAIEAELNALAESGNMTASLMKCRSSFAPSGEKTSEVQPARLTMSFCPGSGRQGRASFLTANGKVNSVVDRAPTVSTASIEYPL